MAKPVTSATAAQTATATATAAKVDTPQAPLNKGEVAVYKGLNVQQYIDEVFAGEREKQIIGALSDVLPFARFRASVANALMNNPKLMKCPPALVFREAARVAQVGLLFDHHLGEAWLIEGWNAKAQQNEPQARIGYRGLMKLARMESKVRLWAHEVHENDDFECVLGLEKILVHKPKVFATDRGPVTGYYAVIKFDKDDYDFEPMSLAEVHGIRDRADAYKAFVAKKIKTTPWVTDEIEMGKKTVLRRLCKRLELGPKFRLAQTIEDDADGVIIDSKPPTRREATTAPQGGAAALDRFAKPTRGNGTLTDIPQEQGGGGGEDEHHQEQEQEQAQQNGGGIYVEPEDEGQGQPAEQQAQGGGDPPAERSHAELLAFAPKMPEETAKAMTAGKVVDAWKWLNIELPKLDIDVRQALINEHADLLWGLIEKSDGYKKAVLSFLTAQDVTLKPKEAS